ncbi:MmgE/PrpD family protein [Paenibacillus thalictri]|uniref:MmgE/PrpD family protein n=1 Tax=Paenibacillus thalictri TaxID=2527873 RepID=A0A4Q9DPS2_9BACL|nr:MmgE/PrpD family protein [Paenibacillus thalictri]TBL76318.1 MmgE/PrpD family protein [Paenibacillus thalictri]
MTLQRDLAWQNLELLYQSSVAHQYARYALGLNYEMLPQDVVHQAKRCLLDALGCAIGAYDAPGRKMVEDYVAELGGNEEATLFGTGKRSTVLNATLLNSFLVRYLDYNDCGGGAHNSDSISGILATAEHVKASGRDLLTSIVISYELGARVQESTGKGWGESLGAKGWTPDFRGGLNMPPALGKMMKLSESQIANAIGICASHSLPLGILDTDNEENTMSKNFRFGFVAHDAVIACRLAAKGFTGPLRVVEGENGIGQVVLQGNMDINRMTNFSGWRILQTKFKYLPANISSIAHILATLSIVNEHDLTPEQIASVRIRAGLKESKHTTYFAKKYPRNAESADHSAFYANAIAIKERAYGPQSFDPEKYTDPVVLDLIEKITVEADPSIPERDRAGISEIMMTDGRRFEKRIDVPHGFGNDPLSDAELEEKFGKMAAPYMSDEQIRSIFKTIWTMEHVDHVESLTALMAFSGKL